MPKKYITKKEQSKIDKVTALEESLLEQLTLKKANIEAFESQVNHYVYLERIAIDLQADIEERGINITDITASGIPVTKPNPSIKELREVNKQQLAILKQLNLTCDTVVSASDIDDEL